MINLGTIEVSNNGSVVLAANEVVNSGTIKAIKGKVHLTAANEYRVNLNGNSLVKLIVNKGVLDAMVENSGTISANGGEIYLTTNAVNELLKGVVNNTGIIEANSLDGLMGKVEVFAHGGEVQVGGTIESKDGFVETSGKDFTVKENAVVKAGEWLIDPIDITIDATLASTIVTALGSGDVTIKTDNPTNTSTVTVPISNKTSTDGNIADGDIYVNSAITWSSANKLTLQANDAIYVNAIIENTNSTNGGVYFNAANKTNKVIFDTNGKVIVNNVNQLEWINTALNGTYELGRNINAYGWTNTLSNLTFNGTFDGLGHTIDKISIENGATNSGGLFGTLSSTSTVKNIGLTNVDITGTNNIGGLVGKNGGTITNSYVTGKVTGTYGIGGLVGWAYIDSSITNSYSTANVTGTHSNGSIGGLVGWNKASVLNSYATGNVSGISSVGGLVGKNEIGSIINSYSIGKVSLSSGSSTAIGGLIGNNTNGTITNSFWNIATSGQDTSKGGIGKTTSEDMQNISTFSNASWAISTSSQIPSNYLYPILVTKDGITSWKIYTNPASVTYNLSDILSGYTYNKNEYALSSLWTANTIFSNNFNDWVLGTDYNFIYNSAATTGFTNAGTYSNISINILKDGFMVGDEGNTLGKFVIDKINITAISGITGIDKTYDGLTSATLNTSNAVITGIIDGDNLNLINSTGVFSDKNVGSNKNVNISLSLSGIDSANYNLPTTISDTVAATITKANATVTANSDSKTYTGLTQSVLGFTASGLVNGETISVLDGVSGASSSGINTGTYTTVLAGTDENYNLTFNNGSLIITPKAITVSADDLSKIYGDTEKTLTYTASGLVGTDTLSGTLKRVAGENVGEYAISEDTALTNSNYTVSFTDGKYTITPKAITVSADDLSKIYGDDEKTLTYTANGLVGTDTLSGTLKRVDGENVGNYIISENTALANSNYTVTFSNGKYTITPKVITVSADDLEKVYGQEDSTLTYTANGLVGTDKLTGTLKRTTGENVGEYAISEDTTLTNSNYTVTFTDGKYTITPKAITVSADDLEKVYGQTDKTLTYTANGLVGTDILSGTLKRVAGENKGDYAISQDTALTNSNYTVTFSNGKYTITPKAITVSADDLEKVYGQEDSTLTYTANGLETGDTLSGTLKRVAGENVGEYAISEDTALTNSNYTVSFTDGKYTITPKAITVSADDLSKIYGDDEKTLTYTANGLVGTDTLSGTLKRVDGENVGNYIISENTALANSNYTVTFSNGKYTITPKAITVSADDLSKIYGDTEKTLTYTASGLVGTDTLSGTLKRVAGENVGEYAISEDTALANSNYTVTFSNGKYTITPKAIANSPSDNSIIENIITPITNQTALKIQILPVNKHSIEQLSQEEIGTNPNTKLGKIQVKNDLVIEIVNGGVNLPAGVKQLFFTDTDEN